MNSKLILLSLLLLAIVYAQDSEFGLDKIRVQVLGHSGKVKIYMNTTEQNTSSFIINFDSIIEKDVNGNQVGKTGSVKHSFENFAQLNFEFSNMTNTTYQNLATLNLNFTASRIIDNNTTFTGIIYIFNQTGSINLGGNQTAEVYPGTVKLSFLIENWPFCVEKSVCLESSCCSHGNVDEIGSFIDLQIQVDGDNLAKSLDSNEYDFGTSSLILSKSVNLDGKDVQMPIEFPLYTKSPKDTFTFRIPKFNQSALYDPIVTMNISHSGFSGLLIVIIIAATVLVILGISFVLCRNNKRNKSDSLINNSNLKV